MGSSRLFNGNIAWMSTDIREVGRRNGEGYQAMMYGYDQLNRIKSAKSLTAFSGA
jgi:hypothetical protein